MGTMIIDGVEYVVFKKSEYSQRVKDGLAKAKAEGVVLGRPRLPVDGNAVKATYDRLQSIRMTADALGLNRSTVHRTLQRLAVC